jgi:hypothetical protein
VKQIEGTIERSLLATTIERVQALNPPCLM